MTGSSVPDVRQRRTVPAWLKVVLVLVTVTGGVASLLVVGLLGYRLFQLGEPFWEASRRGQADGARFAATHDGAQCWAEVVTRLDGPAGLVKRTEVKKFLGVCLLEARESPGTCAGVPPRSEIVESAFWSVCRCHLLRRLDNDLCHELLAMIQRHCERRGSKPVPRNQGAPAAHP